MAETARHTASPEDNRAHRTAGDPSVSELGASCDESEDRSGPLRRCLVTGESRPKSELIRFVIGPDGRAVPDLEGVLPGRGLWVTAAREPLDRAVARNLFAKAARRPVVIDDGLVDRIEQMLLRRCIELIGLARRAGAAVAGYQRVAEFRKRNPVRVVLTATDAASAGTDKLAAQAPGAHNLRVLDGYELGRAFGADHRVHAVVAPGALAERLVAAAGRLAALRSRGPHTPKTDNDTSKDMTGR
jgi:predicted RNA-binding protein YlxR (DUF448 family)